MDEEGRDIMLSWQRWSGGLLPLLEGKWSNFHLLKENFEAIQEA